MATSTKNKSHGKEKTKTSSTPNQKPSPHYLKPTISFAMDTCTYPATKQTTSVLSDDTSATKQSPRTRRKSLDNKPPSPSPLKKALSISPRGTKPVSSSPPSRKGISPRSVPERGFTMPTMMRNGKEEASAKGPVVKKSASAITNGKEERSAKGVGVKKNTNATTRPKTGTKPTTSTTTTTAPSTISPKKKKIVKRKEGEKAAPVKEIQEEIVEVVEEKTIQVESPPSQDQSCPNPTDSELKNAASFDSSILSEEDELITVNPKEENEETHATEDEVTEQPEETNVQDTPKVEEKEKEMVHEETRETKGVTNNKPSSAEEHEPYKLKFRQRKQLNEKEVGDESNLRIKYKDRKETVERKGEGRTEGEEEGKGESNNVVLKKQDVQEKKESPVANDVIGETASKLVEKRKSKVKALVGAFETVMNVEQETEG